MRRRTVAVVVTGFMSLCGCAPAAMAQLPPAASLVPAGFTVETERNLGGSIVISARKPNENFPKPHGDQGIVLEISWMNQPMAAQMLEMVASQPEEPGGQLPGSATRIDPCGKERYHDGVLVCRKSTIPWIGGGSGPALVTWQIGWTGKGATGMVGVRVNNVYGSRETAMVWIDAIIPRITKGQ